MQLNYGVVKMEIVISFPCEVSRIGKNIIFFLCFRSSIYYGTRDCSATVEDEAENKGTRLGIISTGIFLQSLKT